MNHQRCYQPGFYVQNIALTIGDKINGNPIQMVFGALGNVSYKNDFSFLSLEK